MRALTVDRAAGIAFGVFSLLVLWESRAIPFGTLAEPGPGALPVLLAITLLACSVTLFAGGRVGPHFVNVLWSEWRHAIAILGTCAFMALALERLGYRVTMFVALLMLVSVVEKKQWIAGVLFAGAFSLGTYYLFHTLLRVPLPRGFFGY